MTTIPHVIRRGAIYYWRRRLPPSTHCAPRLISLSLETADPRRARQKAAYLTARSQHAFERARKGMLNETEIKAIMRLAAIEIEELYRIEHLKDLATGGIPSRDMAGLSVIEQARVASEFNRRRGSSIPLGTLTSGEITALTGSGWSAAMVRALNAQLDLAASFSTFPLEELAFEHIARQAGIERRLSEAELFQIHQSVARARAVVLKRFADGADVDTAADEAAIFSNAVEPALAPVIAAGPASIPVTAVVAATPFPPAIRTGFEVIRGMLISEKQKEKDWTPKTARQSEVIFRLFFAFLEVRKGKTALEEVEQVDLDDFDALLLGLDPRHGKSAGDQELSGIEYIEKYSQPRSRHEGIMAGVTLNRHWGFIEQLFDRARRRGVKLNSLDFECFLRKKKQTARDERPTPAAETIRAFFRLPIFTGCEGPDLRKTKGGRPMYLAGTHVFHRAAYFGPMIAHYHGFRREEFCGLAIVDIEVVDDYPVFQIRENQFRRLKNLSSKRTHVIHPELVRLGFLNYVERIRNLGFDRVFPDLVAPGSDRPAGERLYDELEPAFENTDLVTHGFRHFFNNDLKKQDIREENRADLMGHSHSSETAGRYADSLWGEWQLSMLALVENVTSHLEPHEIRLLPWVAKRHPPPWIRKNKAG